MRTVMRKKVLYLNTISMVRRGLVLLELVVPKSEL